MKYATAALILTLCACAKTPDPNICSQGPIPQGPTRLIAAGDSQTFGAKSCLEGSYYSWAYEAATDLHLELVQTAVPGSKFVPDEATAILAQAYQPTDTIAMLIGFNDAMTYGTDQTHLAEFQSTLAQVLTTLSPQVAKIVIAGSLHPYHYEMEMSPDAVDIYSAAIAQTVAQLGLPNVVYIPSVDAPFVGNSDYYRNDDGIHLLAQAQTIVGYEYMSAIGLQY